MESELAGKKADFEVEVTLVKEVELPELNDDLAKLYGLKTVDELKKNVRMDLEMDAQYRERQSIESQIAKALLEKVNFDLPDSLLEYETASIVERIVRQNKERKVRDEVINAKMGEIRENAAKQAVDNLRVSFIIDKIASVEKIQASENELKTRIATLAQMNKIPLQKFVKRLQENRGIGQIASEIVRSKVIELLKLHAVVKEVPAPAEKA